jgi:hypothetical protein
MLRSTILEPNFFIIGAPKCGTSALHGYLSAHPQVFMTEIKEPHHYSVDLPGRGIFDRDEYLSLFAGARPEHAVRGESSVYYLYSQQALPRILAEHPEAKFVAMLRNPIDLVTSLHAQLLTNLNEDVADFSTAWRLQGERRAGRKLPPACMEPTYVQYAQVAQLGEQLARAMNVVDLARLCLVVFDDFQQNPAATYARVLEFLSLPHDGRTEFPRLNGTTKLRRAWFRHLINERRVPLFLRRWGRACGVHRVHKALKRWNEVPAQRGAVEIELRREMAATFHDDIHLLSQLVQRDLTHWLAV